MQSRLAWSVSAPPPPSLAPCGKLAPRCQQQLTLRDVALLRHAPHLRVWAAPTAAWPASGAEHSFRRAHAGVIKACLRKDDFICSTYRDHVHALSKGVSARKVGARAVRLAVLAVLAVQPALRQHNWRPGYALGACTAGGYSACTAGQQAGIKRRAGWLHLWPAACPARDLRRTASGAQNAALCRLPEEHARLRPQVMAELFGKKTGCCRGQGGSMHMFDREHGLVGAGRGCGSWVRVVGAGRGCCAVAQPGTLPGTAPRAASCARQPGPGTGWQWRHSHMHRFADSAL